jgi:hypothetical protein
MFGNVTTVPTTPETVTKEQITEALAALGSTADEVAATLLAKGCHGVEGQCSACPVAIYLHKCFPGVGFTVTFGSAHIHGGGSFNGRDYHPLSAAARSFISAFDSGLYPELRRLKGAHVL